MFANRCECDEGRNLRTLLAKKIMEGTVQLRVCGVRVGGECYVTPNLTLEKGRS